MLGAIHVRRAEAPRVPRTIEVERRRLNIANSLQGRYDLRSQLLAAGASADASLARSGRRCEA